MVLDRSRGTRSQVEGMFACSRLIGFLLVLLLVGGCRSTPMTPPGPADASVALELLAVTPRPSADHLYRRAHFGTAWHEPTGTAATEGMTC